VVEAGSNKEKITFQIPGEQQAREQVQARRRIRKIDDNDDNDDNIAIPNSLAGNRNDAAPKYVGHVPNYPRSCNTFITLEGEGRCSLWEHPALPTAVGPAAGVEEVAARALNLVVGPGADVTLEQWILVLPPRLVC